VDVKSSTLRLTLWLLLLLSHTAAAPVTASAVTSLAFNQTYTGTITEQTVPVRFEFTVAHPGIIVIHYATDAEVYSRFDLDVTQVANPASAPEVFGSAGFTTGVLTVPFTVHQDTSGYIEIGWANQGPGGAEQVNYRVHVMWMQVDDLSTITRDTPIEIETTIDEPLKLFTFEAVAGETLRLDADSDATILNQIQTINQRLYSPLTPVSPFTFRAIFDLRQDDRLTMRSSTPHFLLVFSSTYEATSSSTITLQTIKPDLLTAPLYVVMTPETPSQEIRVTIPKETRFQIVVEPVYAKAFLDFQAILNGFAVVNFSGSVQLPGADIRSTFLAYSSGQNTLRLALTATEFEQTEFGEFADVRLALLPLN